MSTENENETATSSININIVSSTSGSVDEGNSVSSGNSSNIKADGPPSTVQLPISAISAPSPVTTKAKNSSNSNSNSSNSNSSSHSHNHNDSSSSDNETSTNSSSSNNNTSNPTRTTPSGKNGKPLTVTVNGNDRSKDLNEHDVVCEKGRGDHERWPGNKLYRHLINVNKETYNDLAPIERSNIIGKIIGAIQEKDGWFVHHSEATSNWAKLTEEKVRKKVSDDLRREVRRRREKRSHNSLFSAKLRAIKEMEEAEVAARDILGRVDDPRQNDVLFGPGSRRHPGNKIYWHHMKLNLDQYIISPYGARSIISRNIVGIVRSQHGRFLEQDPKTGIWYSISDKRALEKTSHALSNMKYKTRKRHPDEPPFPLQSPSQQQQQQLDPHQQQQQQQQQHHAAAANMYNVNVGGNGGIGHHAHVPHGFVPAPPHAFHHMHHPQSQPQPHSQHHHPHPHHHQQQQQRQQHPHQPHGQHPPHSHNYQHLTYQQPQQQRAVGPYGEDIVVYDDDITLDQEKIMEGDSPNTVFAKTRTKKFRLINRMDDDVDVPPGTVGVGVGVGVGVVAPTPPPKGDKDSNSTNMNMNINAMTRTTTSASPLSDVDPSGVVVSTKAIGGSTESSTNISAPHPTNTNAATIIDTMGSISNNTNIIAKLDPGADPTTTTPGGVRKGGKIISPNSSQASVSESGSGIEYQEQRNPNTNGAYRRQIVQHVPGSGMPPVIGVGVGVGSPSDNATMDYHHRPAATAADIAPRIAHFEYIKNYGAPAAPPPPPPPPGAAFKTLTYAVGMRAPDVSEYAPHPHHGQHTAVVPGPASVHMRRRQYLEREVAVAAAHAARGGHGHAGHAATAGQPQHAGHGGHGSHGHHPPFAAGAGGQAEAAALNARRWAAAASAGGPPGYY